MPIALIILLTLGLGACLEPSHGKNPPADSGGGFGLNGALPNKMRGYEAVNGIVKQRIFLDASGFALIFYLEEPDNSIFSNGSPFKKLLGAYDGNGARLEYQGREPNAMSMLLWHTLFSLFAKDLALTCDEHEKPSVSLAGLSDEFRDNLCEGMNEGESFMRDPWQKLWQVALAADATDEEEDLWLAFIEERFQEGQRGNALAEDALVTMFMSPYFLVTH